MDSFSPKERSRIMSRIRSEDTRPEIMVRKLLFSSGFRYRLHRKDLPGHPDIVLASRRVVIFVNGCFWHQHQGCTRATRPSSNTEYWSSKLARNCARDQQVHQQLQDLGWRVLVVWECACTKSLSGNLGEALKAFINESDSPFAEVGRKELPQQRLGD